MEPAAADTLEGDDLFAQLVQDDANEPPPPAADAADDPEPIETLVEDDAAAASSADRFSSGLQALTEETMTAWLGHSFLTCLISLRLVSMGRSVMSSMLFRPITRWPR